MPRLAAEPTRLLSGSQDMSDERTDILVIGGGSAGCVLAARLSERATLRVTLVEAGPDTPPGAVPADIRSSYPGRAYFNAAYSWPELRASLGGAHLNAPESRALVRYEQARIMGGGSSINGIGVNRGAPADYEEWHAAGATGWRWADVEPYFLKAERDLDFHDSAHGQAGAIPVRRIPQSGWSGFTHAVVEALHARGHAPYDDQNGAWCDGVMPTSLNLDENWERVSTATGYLTPAVRARANLRILPRHTARRLLFEGRRVVGAEIESDGATKRIAAGLTILSSGAINTPTFLLRNGIGPASELAALAIPVIVDRRGVGRNLMEHPATNMSCLLARDARLPRADDYHIQMIWRFSSRLHDAPPGDMHVAIASRTAWHAIGRRIGSLVMWVNKSYSRGWVRLRDAKAASPPEVDFRLLSDRRDLERLMAAFRMAADLLEDPALDGVRRVAFPTFLSNRIRSVSKPSTRNALLLAMVGMLIDATGRRGDALMKSLASQDIDLATLRRDDDALAAYLAKATTGVWHASGTARMGAATDPLAVTDSEGAVHGLAGLHVCDGSLMPTIPCANLNLPIIMTAEKIADALKRRL